MNVVEADVGERGGVVDEKTVLDDGEAILSESRRGWEGRFGVVAATWARYGEGGRLLMSGAMMFCNLVGKLY